MRFCHNFAFSAVWLRDIRAVAFATVLTFILVGSCHDAPIGGIKPLQERDMARSGSWLQFRGDRCLTGRSFLKGNITMPAIKWKKFVGAREMLLLVRFGAGKTARLPLPNNDLNADRYEALTAQWGIGRPRFDLDSDGNLTAISPSTSHKIGKFLLDRPGLQKVEFESLFQKVGASPPGEEAQVFGRLMARKNGQWEQVWQSDPIPLLYSANAIVGDFDSDGELEVALVPWYDLWVLDLKSGKLETKCRFTPPGAESGRAYGWLGAFDLDGDGKQEFIVIGDFENQIDILCWKGGQLHVLWQRLIERGITRKETALHPGVNPVADVDGDRRLEITVSMFNASGDDKWHVIVLDGMTGETKLDLPNQYLTGLCDLDGDGVAELFCTLTQGALIPTRSQLSVISFKDSKATTRWQENDASFQTQPVQDFPLNVNSCAATGRMTLLTGAVEPTGKPLFFTRKAIGLATGLVELTAWQADANGHIQRLGSLTGPYLEALAARPDDGVLVRALVPGDGEANVVLFRVVAQPLASRLIGVPLSSVVVGRLTPKSSPTVIVQDACENLMAFQPLMANRPAKMLWRVPGRGIYTGSVHEGGGAPYGGVMLADLNGDGTLEIIAATSSPEGCARLIALAPDGSEIWHHDFDRFPGAPPNWNIGGLTMWFAGHFTDPKRDDVMVSLRRSTMHSDETFLLDGRTSEIIWHRTEGGHSAGSLRACGGSWVAVYDHDGDGLDDALLLYPDLFTVIQGSTGKLLVDRHTNNDIFPGSWSFYAMPVVTDFLGNGKQQVLYGASTYMLGLLEIDGKVIWSEGPSSGTPAILAGIGDVDGDGKLELLSPGHCRQVGSTEQEFRCYDAAKGRPKWRLPLPGSCFSPNNGFVWGTPMTPAVADINNDGRDECIFAILNTLYAIGASKDGKAGEIRWTLSLPNLIGPAAIADADGSGQAQIIVICADGYVYGIGAKDETAH